MDYWRSDSQVSHREVRTVRKDKVMDRKKKEEMEKGGMSDLVHWK